MSTSPHDGHPPCCRAGQGPGYCTTYGQFMPPYLHSICEGACEGKTAGDCLAYRREWDRIGGPLALKLAAPAGRVGETAAVPRPPEQPKREPCKYLGEWTGRLCGH